MQEQNALIEEMRKEREELDKIISNLIRDRFSDEWSKIEITGSILIEMRRMNADRAIEHQRYKVIFIT